VSETLKTLTVNAFISWRMTQSKCLLETNKTFKSLNSFRCAFNNTLYLSDFALYAAIELLAHAAELEKSGIVSSNSLDTVPVEEALRLACQVKQRKMNRFEFFNTEDGRNLCLHVSAHEKTQLREKKYCALCGNNSRPEGNEFRGHR
jgi:hypothetical protein